MNRHLRSWTTSRDGDDQGDPGASISNGTGTAAATVHALPYLTPAPTRRWEHTLTLRGSLDSDSAPKVEDEIECLCEEGVTTLTLDLRQLDAIDQHGIELIESRSALWERRGREFGVVLGSAAMHRAFADAGAMGLLTPATTRIPARRSSGPPCVAGLTDVSTTMIIELGLE